MSGQRPKETEPVRLSKLMSQRGICSRREADQLIRQGRVYVDGHPMRELGIKVCPDQRITLSEKAIEAQRKRVTVLLNKPMNYVSGSPEKQYSAAVELINKTNRQFNHETTPKRTGLAPAGRLDIDSTGLMVFTQDGRIAKQLIGPNSRIEKEYRVWVSGKITTQKVDRLCGGLSLDGRPLKPAQVAHLTGSQLGFILTEGRKRQIRRMCALVELSVTRLLRVRIGRITLGNLEVGKWRLLRDDEVF